MKRSKVNTRGSSSKSKSKSPPKAKARGGRAVAALRSKPPARTKAKPKAETKANTKTKTKVNTKTKARAKTKTKTNGRVNARAGETALKAVVSKKAKPPKAKPPKAKPPKAKPQKAAAASSRRDSTLPESQVTKARVSAAANGNGVPKRKKPRIIDVLPRDAPISRPLTAYESEALAVLAAEFPADDPSEANTKIEQRLRDKQLGEFDPERIDVLRSFKSALAEEIHRGQHSKYFTGSHGLYAAPEDFDHARLAEDFAAKYPSISHEAVAAFIPIAVYCYYLR